jgi:ubiquinone/menaquinone biosynthesis C-methylase UbiE
MRSYLEHESEPLGVLKEVYRVLKPGGIAVVKVPNFGSVNRRCHGTKMVWLSLPRSPQLFHLVEPKEVRRCLRLRNTF